jgi:hypothetical protein
MQWIWTTVRAKVNLKRREKHFSQHAYKHFLRSSCNTLIKEYQTTVWAKVGMFWFYSLLKLLVKNWMFLAIHAISVRIAITWLQDDPGPKMYKNRYKHWTQSARLHICYEYCAAIYCSSDSVPRLEAIKLFTWISTKRKSSPYYEDAHILAL